jgi:uncharacterized protein YodC (DUF2158 family)
MRGPAMFEAGDKVQHIQSSLEMTVDEVISGLIHCSWSEDGEARKGKFMPEEIKKED